MSQNDKRIEGLRAAIDAQISRGADASLAYLHIPKTGGTSLHALFAERWRQGRPAPLYLPHHCDMDAIDALLPDARIILVTREPLERMASGFLSRLRQGRPRYDRPWTRGEATAFSVYRQPGALFRALLSADEFDISMSAFALCEIAHLRRGYQHYFHSAERVRKAKARFALVGEIGAMGRFIEGLAALLGAPAAELSAAYAPAHVGAVGGGAAIAALSDAERAELRLRLGREYGIWSALREMVG
ncbi:MAG: hypothetical protein WD969_01285 [Paracoccaceae bacterium]